MRLDFLYSDKVERNALAEICQTVARIEERHVFHSTSDYDLDPMNFARCVTALGSNAAVDDARRSITRGNAVCDRYLKQGRDAESSAEYDRPADTTLNPDRQCRSRVYDCRHCQWFNVAGEWISI